MDLSDENRNDHQSPPTDPLMNENYPLEENNEALEGPVSSEARQQQRTFVWAARTILSPFLDDSGIPGTVSVGILVLGVIGSIIGVLLPKNNDLPTPWYRYVSSAIGYTYFLCWSVSFYPQLVINLKRKSTQGLSADFCVLNVVGFAFYAIYNVAFFSSPYIQELYKHRRHGGGDSITVQSNDVAFAVHAFVISSLTVLQIVYYNRGLPALSSWTVWVLRGLLVVCGGYLCLTLAGTWNCNWIDFLYLLSSIKILISLIKYVPQVILNKQRKSTRGWSIWNVLLDFSGGVLSDLQLILDCADLGDWTGITGNVAKFGLGFVSILFDIIFMLQHYVLYRGGATDVLPPSTLSSSLIMDEERHGPTVEHPAGIEDLRSEE